MRRDHDDAMSPNSSCSICLVSAPMGTGAMSMSTAKSSGKQARLFNLRSFLFAEVPEEGAHDLTHKEACHASRLSASQPQPQ